MVPFMLGKKELSLEKTQLSRVSHFKITVCPTKYLTFLKENIFN